MAPFYNKPLRGNTREGEVSYLTQRHLSVVDALDHATFARAWPELSCDSMHVGNEGFYGTPTRDAAFEIARLGWAEDASLSARPGRRCLRLPHE